MLNWNEHNAETPLEGIDGLRPLTDDERRAIEEFSRAMREVVIPSIVENLKMRQQAAADKKGFLYALS